MRCIAFVRCSGVDWRRAGARRGYLAHLHAAKIYTAPDAPAIADGVVRRSGMARSLRQAPRTPCVIPEGARDLRVQRRRGDGGFPEQPRPFHGSRAGTTRPTHPRRVSRKRLEAMLTRYGFTTVFDTGSDVRRTPSRCARASRRAKCAARAFSPWALPLYPPDGIPYYIRDLPPEQLAKMHQPRNAAEARADVRAESRGRRGRHQAVPAHLARQEESAFHVGRSRARGRRRNSRAGQTRARPSDQPRRHSRRAGRGRRHPRAHHAG